MILYIHLGASETTVPSCDYVVNDCNCYYIKDYGEELNISCFALGSDCHWFHKINNTNERIEDIFRNDANGISLPGNSNVSNYGNFTANSSNGSCSYLVVPPISTNRGTYMHGHCIWFSFS